MPVYEFECKACKKIFSLTMPVIEVGKSKISCPHCENTKIRQVISVFSVVTARKS
jgi:putative FmdB family regulatory protein